jgi:aminopeptidase YwaD
MSSRDSVPYLRVESRQSNRRRSSAVYLGTIPDYAADLVGVKLSGTRPSSPAEKAGLLADDVIIELNGVAIKNIYDYTQVLDSLTIGVQTTVVVLRANQRLTLDLVPGSR